MNITDNFLTINPYSRSGYKRPETLAVVLHWVGNAGQSAFAVRDYFESLKDGINVGGKPRYASAQFVIGIDGSIIRTMPDDEIAYHCGCGGKIDPASGKFYTEQSRRLFGTKYTMDPYSPSYVTVGIEMCHKTWTGEFTMETLESATELTKTLFYRYSKLEDPSTQIMTHFSVVGHKPCPLWFYNHPGDLTTFQQRVGELVQSP
jgi:N-acetylmuramoyl-L-alanine amidase